MTLLCFVKPSNLTMASLTPTYVKLIRKNCIHNGLLLREGLNRLLETETFDERPECGPGGLYFCKEEDICYWLSMYGADLGFVATVTLCPDSTCVTMNETHKLKTDRFLLGPFQPVEEFLTEDKAEQAVMRCCDAIEYLPEKWKTLRVCLAAVQHNGYAISHVPSALQTAELCLAAVQQDGNVLKCVPPALQTAELCLAAVQQDGRALRYVPPALQTAELCQGAVQQSWKALEHVPAVCMTTELCLGAVQQDGHAIMYVPTAWQTAELYLVAVQQNGLACVYVPRVWQTAELRLAAVQQNELVSHYLTTLNWI